MFGSIKKRIKKIFSKMVKHTKSDKNVFKKLEDCENLVDDDLDNSYNKINNKIIEAIKEYDELNSKQSEIIQIKVDSNIKTKNEIIRDKLEKDYTKNIEKVLQNKIHRKDRHKNNKYK